MSSREQHIAAGFVARLRQAGLDSGQIKTAAEAMQGVLGADVAARAGKLAAHTGEEKRAIAAAIPFVGRLAAQGGSHLLRHGLRRGAQAGLRQGVQTAVRRIPGSNIPTTPFQFVSQAPGNSRLVPTLTRLGGGGGGGTGTALRTATGGPGALVRQGAGATQAAQPGGWGSAAGHFFRNTGRQFARDFSRRPVHTLVGRNMLEGVFGGAQLAGMAPEDASLLNRAGRFAAGWALGRGAMGIGRHARNLNHALRANRGRGSGLLRGVSGVVARNPGSAGFGAITGTALGLDAAPEDASLLTQLGYGLGGGALGGGLGIGAGKVLGGIGRGIRWADRATGGHGARTIKNTATGARNAWRSANQWAKANPAGAIAAGGAATTAATTGAGAVMLNSALGNAAPAVLSSLQDPAVRQYVGDVANQLVQEQTGMSLQELGDMAKRLQASGQGLGALSGIADSIFGIFGIPAGSLGPGQKLGALIGLITLLGGAFSGNSGLTAAGALLGGGALMGLGSGHNVFQGGQPPATQ